MGLSLNLNLTLGFEEVLGGLDGDQFQRLLIPDRLLMNAQECYCVGFGFISRFDI